VINSRTNVRDVEDGGLWCNSRDSRRNAIECPKFYYAVTAVGGGSMTVHLCQYNENNRKCTSPSAGTKLECPLPPPVSLPPPSSLSPPPPLPPPPSPSPPPPLPSPSFAQPPPPTACSDVINSRTNVRDVEDGGLWCNSRDSRRNAIECPQFYYGVTAIGGGSMTVYLCQYNENKRKCTSPGPGLECPLPRM